MKEPPEGPFSGSFAGGLLRRQTVAAFALASDWQCDEAVGAQQGRLLLDSHAHLYGDSAGKRRTAGVAVATGPLDVFNLEAENMCDPGCAGSVNLAPSGRFIETAVDHSSREASFLNEPPGRLFENFEGFGNGELDGRNFDHLLTVSRFSTDCAIIYYSISSIKMQ